MKLRFVCGTYTGDVWWVYEGKKIHGYIDLDLERGILNQLRYLLDMRSFLAYNRGIVGNAL